MEINKDLIIEGTATSLEDVANLRRKILWTNSSPEASFSSQTITFSNSDYDYYMIIFATSTSLAVLDNTGLIPKGKRTELSTTYAEGGGWYIRYRGIDTATSNTLHFQDSVTREVSSQQTTNNYFCIPLYVIGYKA